MALAQLVLLPGAQGRGSPMIPYPGSKGRRERTKITNMGRDRANTANQSAGDIVRYL